MLKTTEERAYAKLNLTLGVLFKRMDGYHALDSIMQSIDLYDTVRVTRASSVSVSSVGMALPEDNTLLRAAALYRRYTGRGAKIEVVKRIPAEAGMGGGSADAAAVLRALDALYGDLDTDSLFTIARAVGADVPFCIRGGTQRAQGVGEVLTPLARGKDLFFTVLKPAAGVSTGMLFSRLPLPRPMPDNTRAASAIVRGDLHQLGELLFNALSAPAETFVPKIADYKQRLLNAGALGAEMTGSGSAVFGLFESLDDAEKARALADVSGFSCICRAV